MLIANDDFQLFLRLLTMYVNETYDQMHPNAIMQIIWIIEQIDAVNQKAELESISIALIRSIYPGSLSSDTNVLPYTEKSSEKYGQSVQEEDSNTLRNSSRNSIP